MSLFERFMTWNDGDRAATAASAVRLPRWKEVSSGLKESAARYRDQHPEDAETVHAFQAVLENEVRRRYSKPHGAAAPQDAYPCIFLSEDRMTALLCVFPPLEGGADITEERLRTDLHYEGIEFGLLEDRLQACVEKQEYLQILPLAYGTPARDGEEGRLEELFEHREDRTLEVPTGMTIDFHADDLVWTVHKGEPLCRIYPSVQGEDGFDVTGWTIPCKQVAEVKVPAGRNTSLSPDGLTLVADMDGILYTVGGEYCVRPQKLFSGDLDSFEGVLKIQGDLYIPGNVFGGVTIQAGSDIIIAGEVRDAEIVSARGSIRVQKGIHGVAGKTRLKAARQIQAQVIEQASVEAGDDVVAEVIADSEVISRHTVSVTGGRGLILGGHVQAGKQILCRQIGNLTGKHNRVTVGYSPEVAVEQERIDKGLASTKDTIEKLWDTIATLRKMGSKLPQDQKELLDLLVEQRGLYEEQEKRLKEEQKELRAKMKAASTGRIVCQQLDPVTAIQIGLCKAEYSCPETNCNIHVYGESIMLH